MPQSNVIYTLCYCANFQFNELQAYLQQHYESNRFRNVIQLKWQQGKVYIFDYGVVVFWNVDPYERHDLLEKLTPFSNQLLIQLIEDEFTFSSGGDALSIKNDHISLNRDEPMIRLALSHGLAQSTKLAHFEFQVQNTINDTAYIPKNIADTGKSKLSAKELAQLRGRLFISKSNIMLNYDLLDVPDFFWENPELDSLYGMVSDYLEIKQRIEVLSKKLETIHELFEMMSEEQKHKHSSLLEWIIIWLIAFEVFVTIFHDLLGYI